METTLLSVVPGTLEHGAQVAENMRDADALELRRTGFTPQEAMDISIKASVYCRAALEGDTALAVWGLSGCLVGDEYFAWLLTAKGAERHKMAFLRIGRREVAAMSAFCPKLMNFVDAEYSGALRLVEKLGFKIHPSEPMFTGAHFCRVERV